MNSTSNEPDRVVFTIFASSDSKSSIASKGNDPEGKFCALFVPQSTQWWFLDPIIPECIDEVSVSGVIDRGNDSTDNACQRGEVLQFRTTF